MKNFTLFILLFCSLSLFAQDIEIPTVKKGVIFTPEIMGGVTAEPNSNFPEHDFHKQFMIGLGWEHDTNSQEWARRLKGPRTGIAFGLADFGNRDSLGYAIVAMPFIEFNAFGRKNLKLLVGMGGSYFTKKYDALKNPNNLAVTTDLTWSFRVIMHYKILSGPRLDWRLGGGFFHHSNGHTKLLNQGYNSFLVSLSADIKPSSEENKMETPSLSPLSNSVYSFLSIRTGYGINVLGEAGDFNDKKDVYTISGVYGRVYNNTYKLGIGLYYRYYQHYYDYIVNNESLVQDGREFEHFKENPRWNASNIGISLNGEVLLNHFGIDLQIGVNIHKPAYQFDWRINQGWKNTPRDIPLTWMLGEFDSSYKKKNRIASRLGLKYYIIGTRSQPKNNLFIGANLNANLGQADFSEVCIGYVHSFNFKQK
ncbi:acyloxyacyl hydrolase [Ulvibacter antarcticus]|uniref:Lipid A 3-O-deacylase PagL n=1 Tax=Ulvibacter antarcticus TaxID=442714 RepID=A0A3L9YLI2_9FLAO|nr:acyloxyacyl hydrolase [Ulvibacter antarcticus]RMA59005.1 lipid A 3-O-deacylase PagL [Ulvibacter antarcticus]